MKAVANPKAEQGNHTEQKSHKVEDTETGVQGEGSTLGICRAEYWTGKAVKITGSRSLKGVSLSLWPGIPSYACVGQASMGLRKEQLPWKELRGAGRHFGPNQPRSRALTGHLECPIETKWPRIGEGANEGHPTQKFYWTALFWNHTNNA